jgi:hypothetical protein
VLVIIGAAWYLFVQPLMARQPTKVRTVEIALPVAGIALVLYTLYRNVYPYPKGDAFWLPIATGAWLLIALIGVIVAPAFSRQLGQRMVTDEGMDEM